MGASFKIFFITFINFIHLAPLLCFDKIPTQQLNCGKMLNCLITEYCDRGATAQCAPCENMCRDEDSCKNYCPLSWAFFSGRPQQEGELILKRFLNEYRSYIFLILCSTIIIVYFLIKRWRKFSRTT